MRASHLVLAVALFTTLYSMEAHTSGAYSNAFVSTSFQLTHVGKVRKRFIDDESARAHYARDDGEAKAAFLAAQPHIERALAKAKAAGLPLAPYDLTAPAVRIAKASDVARLPDDAFPLSLSLDVGARETVEQRVTITLEKRPKEAQLAALARTLQQLVRSEPNDDREQAAVVAAGFTAPFAVTHVDDVFALYVGTTAEVPAAEQARVRALLQARLDAALPALRARFAAKDAHAQLGLAAPLARVGPPVAKHPQGLPGAFHPWGPLVSGDLVRMSKDIGGASAIVMIAPGGTYEWGALHRVLGAWLDDALDDPHRRAAAKAIDALSSD